VGAEDRHRVGRHFGKVFDKARAFGLQTLHNMLVVHDFVTHIDRRTELLQRALDDLDGAHDAGAETARLGKYHFHQDLPVRHRLRLALRFTCGQLPQGGPVMRDIWGYLCCSGRVR
jgi:hypothetical protein